MAARRGRGDGIIPDKERRGLLNEEKHVQSASWPIILKWWFACATCFVILATLSSHASVLGSTPENSPISGWVASILLCAFGIYMLTFWELSSEVGKLYFFRRLSQSRWMGPFRFVFGGEIRLRRFLGFIASSLSYFLSAAFIATFANLVSINIG